MTIIVFLLIAVAIIFLINSSSKKSKERQKHLEPHFEAKVEFSGNNDEKGTVVRNDDGSITLRNAGNKRVTLIGASEQIANDILAICDDANSFYDWSKKVSCILMENGIKVKEVEVFFSQVRPIVEKRVNELIANDEEWKRLGARDKEDKKHEFVVNSMVKFEGSVTSVMSTALNNLILDQPIQVPLLNEMLAKYGADNIKTYSGYIGRKNPIIIIKDVSYRKPLEELVKVGLAYTGKDMSVDEILSTLTLAELNEIASTESKFTRKDKAIKFLSEKENISSIIEKRITLRSLFALCPLPEEFKEFDFNKYLESSNYYDNLADALVSLYKGFSPIEYK